MADVGAGAVKIIDNDGDSIVNDSGELKVSIGAAIDLGDVEIKGHVGVSQFTTNIGTGATVLDSQPCKHADIMAKVTNAGIVYVGGSSVAVTTGIALYPGDVYSVDVENTNLIYGIAVNANDDLQVVYYT